MFKPARNVIVGPQPTAFTASMGGFGYCNAQQGLKGWQGHLGCCKKGRKKMKDLASSCCFDDVVVCEDCSSAQCFRCS